MSKKKRPSVFVASDGFRLVRHDTQAGPVWIDDDLVFLSDTTGYPVDCWGDRLDGQFGKSKAQREVTQQCATLKR